MLAVGGSDGTEAAIALARDYWRRAWTALEAAHLVDDTALCDLTDSIIEQLLARHTGG
jgi:hypothetical protein